MPGPLYTGGYEIPDGVSEASGMSRKVGQRLAASYVNFYIANSGIVMPQLDSRWDNKVAEHLRSWFPGRRVVTVPAREILLGGGNIHCITQQIPAGVVAD